MVRRNNFATFELMFSGIWAKLEIEVGKFLIGKPLITISLFELSNFERSFLTKNQSFQLKTLQLKTVQLNDVTNYAFQLHVSCFRGKI